MTTTTTPTTPTTGTRPAGPRPGGTRTGRVPMSPLRRTAFVAGLCYLLSFVSIPTLVLYRGVESPTYVLGPGPDTPVVLGGILELVVALAGIGTAVALFPVLRRQHEGAALGFVGTRVVEAGTIVVCVVSLMSVVSLRQAGVGAAGLVAAQTLVAVHGWVFLLGQGFIPAVNAVLLGSLLYRSRLVPRWLPVLGLVGAPLLVVSVVATLLGAWGQVSALSGLLTVPIAVWEFSLGVYLLVRGFRPSAADGRPGRRPRAPRRRLSDDAHDAPFRPAPSTHHHQEPAMNVPTSAPTRHPLRLTAEPDPYLSRWLWLVKMVLAVPHYVVLVFLGVAFVASTVVAGVAVLITGRYPRRLFAFNVAVLRYSWRVGFYAYAALGTDRYPPFTLRRTDYPADLDVVYPEHLSRRLVLVKGWLLALPHLLLVGLLTVDLLPYPWTSAPDGSPAGVPSSGYSVLNLVVVLAGLFLLVTGQYPRSLFDLLLGINRWCYRVLTYVALMHDEYPPFRLDQGGQDAPVPTQPRPAGQTGARGAQPPSSVLVRNSRPSASHAAP